MKNIKGKNLKIFNEKVKTEKKIKNRTVNNDKIIFRLFPLMNACEKSDLQTPIYYIRIFIRIILRKYEKC